MLRLQKHLFPLHRSASPTHLPLQRFLLSTAAMASSSPGHFVAEDYLVSTCGLTREQAAKAAKFLSHLRSPSKADTVLAYLTSPAFGLSKADIPIIVAKDPRILNCSVDNTLRVRVDGFRSHGFSAEQILTFARLTPSLFRTFNFNKLGFWMSFLGSPEKFLRIMRRNFYVVTSNLDKVVSTNILLLLECGVHVQDIAKMCVSNPRLLTTNPDGVRAIIARADELGVPRNSPMFKLAVATAAGLASETIASKLEMMSRVLGWSDAEVAKVVKMNPILLKCSLEKLQRVSEFLTKVVGLDAKFIMGRPRILMHSLERRLVPRHYVMKVLQEKGLFQKVHSFYTMVSVNEKLFYSRYILRHKDVIPGLANEYVSACKGKIPT